MLGAGSEPTIRCRPPVSEQERSARIPVTGQKTTQRWGDVPGTSRQVHKRSLRVRSPNPVHEHSHTGGRDTCVFINHERVPCRHKRTRKHGNHDRIINISNHADLLLSRHDVDTGDSGTGTRNIHNNFMKPRWQVNIKLNVKYTASIGANLISSSCNNNGYASVRHGNGCEGTPPAHGVVRILSTLNHIEQFLKRLSFIQGTCQYTHPPILGAGSYPPVAL